MSDLADLDLASREAKPPDEGREGPERGWPRRAPARSPCSGRPSGSGSSPARSSWAWCSSATGSPTR